MLKTAVVSDCQRYRYRLTRVWGAGPTLGFVMLNPSTADADQDDPTIRKCMGFARGLGFAGIQVCNLFALRSTDPMGLRAVPDPIGPLNSVYLLNLFLDCDTVIAAWGRHGTYRDRDSEFMDLMERRKMYALRINGDGTPAHPLMLPYASRVVEYRGARHYVKSVVTG